MHMRTARLCNTPTAIQATLVAGYGSNGLVRVTGQDVKEFLSRPFHYSFLCYELTHIEGPREWSLPHHPWKC